MAKTTLKEFLNSDQDLTFHEARICARCMQNDIWQIYVHMSRSMNYELTEDLIYVITGKFHFCDFDLGFLADPSSEYADKSFSELVDDDGWFRFEMLDFDEMGENEVVFLFSDASSCNVRAENIEVRVASKAEVSADFIFGYKLQD